VLHDLACFSQVRLLVERSHETFEALTEHRVTEVVKAGLLVSLGLEVTCVKRHRQNLLLTARRRAAIVALRSSGVTRRVLGGSAPSRSVNFTTRVDGTGADSVRTQRRITGPVLWPAVSSQLATPGSW
jgi:hypothetical protein